MLSGYLITPILLETKEQTSSFSGYLKNFLTRRVLRIFPLYYLYLTALFLTIVLFNLDAIPYFLSLKNQLIYGYTYTYNLYHATVFFEYNLFISHFWSLAVEEQFYIFWPMLVYFVPTKYLPKTLLVIIVCGPIIRVLIGEVGDINPYSIFTESKEAFIYSSTLSHLDAFAIGGLFGVCNLSFIKSKHVFIGLILVLAIGYSTNYYSTNAFYFESLGFPLHASNSYKWIWGYSLLNIGFALIIKSLESRNFVSTIFKNRILVSLGKVSYGLYVYHFGIIYCAQYLEVWLSQTFVNLPTELWDHRIIALLATIIVSYISYYAYEKRFILMKDKYAPRT